MKKKKVDRVVTEAARIEELTGVKTESARDALEAPSVFLSTGNWALDRVMAGGSPGGVPIGPKRGCVVHIAGEPATGKSMLLDHLFGSGQKIGASTLRAETEGTARPDYPLSIGVDIDALKVQFPPTIEAAFDAMLMWSNVEREKHGKTHPVLCGIDTLEMLPAMRTENKLMSSDEGGAFAFGGGRAAAIANGCREATVHANQGPTTFVLLNQMRERPGVFFGSQKTPTGGKMLRFVSTIEVFLSPSKYGQYKVGDVVRGHWVHARVVKNKGAQPFQECDFLISYDRGLMLESGMLELLNWEGRIKVAKTGLEFTDLRTGEVLSIRDFVTWVWNSGVLTEPGKLFGSDTRRAKPSEGSDASPAAG